MLADPPERGPVADEPDLAERLQEPALAVGAPRGLPPLGVGGGGAARAGTLTHRVPGAPIYSGDARTDDVTITFDLRAGSEAGWWANTFRKLGVKTRAAAARPPPSAGSSRGTPPRNP